MAKYERELRGDFDYVLQQIDAGILTHTPLTTFEDGSDFLCGNVRGAIRVYKRYSISDHRLSLSIALFGQGNELKLCAIPSGSMLAFDEERGSMGERSFLKDLIKIVEQMGESGFAPV